MLIVGNLIANDRILARSLGYILNLEWLNVTFIIHSTSMYMPRRSTFINLLPANHSVLDRIQSIDQVKYTSSELLRAACMGINRVRSCQGVPCVACLNLKSYGVIILSIFLHLVVVVGILVNKILIFSDFHILCYHYFFGHVPCRNSPWLGLYRASKGKRAKREGLLL